jgi:hypothetical protein
MNAKTSFQNANIIDIPLNSAKITAITAIAK